MNRYIRDLTAFSQQLGYELPELTKGNHWKFKHRGGSIVITSGTPSDHRAFVNAKATLRKVIVRKGKDS